MTHKTAFQNQHRKIRINIQMHTKQTANMIMAKKSGVDSEIEASYTIDMNFCGGGTNENINTHLWQIYNRKISNSTMNAE